LKPKQFGSTEVPRGVDEPIRRSARAALHGRASAQKRGKPPIGRLKTTVLEGSNLW
jgi:hypothetical protein